jgi:polar amino acid transport system substrate-binding protein
LLPDSVKSAGKIRVASSLGFAPFEFYKEDNKTPQGVDVDLMRALEPVLGVTFDISDVRYPNIVPSLQSQQYDIGWSAIALTPQNQGVAAFATYLSGSSGAVLVSSAKAAGVKTVTDLCGMAVGNVNGEPSDTLDKLNAECAKAGKPAAQFKMFSKTAEIILAIQSGQLDARFSSTLNGNYIAQQSHGTISLIKDILPPTNAVVGVAGLKANASLIKAIAAAFQVIMDNGTYKSILDKWGSGDGALKTSQVTG